MSAQEHIIIRNGTQEDLPRIYQLIMELAIYEKGEEQVTNTLEEMVKDGFLGQPIYHFIVAQKEGSDIVGMALYYWRYSTWKGRRLYLEDIIVTETERGNGVGHRLFKQLITIANEHRCGMMWQVLHWNQPAINFYNKYGAHYDAEWTNGSLEPEDITKLKVQLDEHKNDDNQSF